MNDDCVIDLANITDGLDIGANLAITFNDDDNWIDLSVSTADWLSEGDYYSTILIQGPTGAPDCLAFTFRVTDAGPVVLDVIERPDTFLSADMIVSLARSVMLSIQSGMTPDNVAWTVRHVSRVNLS